MEFNEQAKYENMTLSPIRNLSGREFHTGTRISSTENYLDTKTSNNCYGTHRYLSVAK